MEDTIATTLSEALSWVASATETIIDAMPTDGVDMPLEPPPLGGDEMGPDSSEGSYFLVSNIMVVLHTYASAHYFQTERP
jgi:hypothetical protein